MQKKIIALAVAGLVSGAAFAQSNVTIYGVADVAVAKEKGVSTQAGAAGKFNNGDSRVGFKGSEDLGGGLKANFLFEQGINIANGALTGGTTAYARSAWVGLSGGFGELQIGRNYTAGFKTVAKWELTGYANYADGAGGTGVHGFAGGSRNDAQVLYMSPNMGGVQILVGHVLKQNNVALNEANGKGQTDLGVTYANGPIAAGFVYADNGNGNKDKALGGSFDFGMGKVAAGYYDKAGAHKGYQIGVGAIKAGPVLLTFDYAKDTGSATKPRSYLFEALYPLSKRTFTYAAYRNDDTNATAATNFITAGVRHNF